MVVNVLNGNNFEHLSLKEHKQGTVNIKQVAAAVPGGHVLSDVIKFIINPSLIHQILNKV